MLRVNISDLKTHLSRYLDRIAAGEVVLLCKRNVPIAEIRPFDAVREQPRPIGLGKGECIVGPEFFEPLPDDLLDAFEGKGP